VAFLCSVRLVKMRGFVDTDGIDDHLEMIGHFDDIIGIYYHHCLNFHFITHPRSAV